MTTINISVTTLEDKKEIAEEEEEKDGEDVKKEDSLTDITDQMDDADGLNARVMDVLKLILLSQEK